MTLSLLVNLRPAVKIVTSFTLGGRNRVFELSRRVIPVGYHPGT